MRVAVITPYAGEGDDVLRAAHDSVRAQTMEATHYMVADGQRRAVVDGWAVEHIVLGRAHRDGGCTPRAIGAMAAFASGHDAVAFLDADNRYRPEHLASLVETVERTGAVLAFSDRAIVLADGTPCPFEDSDVVERRHADTNCHFLTSKAAFLAGSWGMMGQALWPLCDRLILAVARRRGLALAWTGQPTVTYTSRWGLHYRAMGLPVPPDEHRMDWARIRADAKAIDGPWFTAEDVACVLGSEHGLVDPDEPEVGDRIACLQD